MMPRNILLMIADDLGNYTGSYGVSSIKTPSLDKLASEGVRFTSAFASTASCSGSRSTIYTGLHTHENGQYGLNIFKTHFQTFPHIEMAPLLFNHGGYLTGILGKVHVGPDEVYPWTWRRESGSRDVAWVADQAEEFFQEAKNGSKPFFLTIGYVDPHRDLTRGGFGNEDPVDGRVQPLDVQLEDVEIPHWLPDLHETRLDFVQYYKAINRMDQGIGMVLQALARQGLADDTLVIFTSDNGPPFINAKTTLYDAGTRLPMIIRRPGGPSGTTNPNMISFIDLLPTLLDWAGLGPGYSLSAVPSDQRSLLTPGYLLNKQKADSPPRLGRSFLPILDRTDLLPDSQWQHHVFGSHTYHELQNYWPTRVLRSRRYKYHRNIAWRLDFPFASDLYASLTFEGVRNADPPMIGKRPLKNYLFRPAEELFDLETDPDEVVNLATDPAYAELLLKLRSTLEAWQKQTGDLWLLRDGCSVKMLSRYAGELEVPDRFDIDADDTRTKGVKLVNPASVGSIA